MAKYYGAESYFNGDVTFYKDVNIQGNLNYDSLNIRNLTVREESILETVTVTERSILGTVKVSSGIVTATSGITTYYGDGNNLIVSGSTLPSASLSAQIVNLEALITTGVPSGVIVMWSGTIANIPTGWRLCNGLNGTPDLRSKFIVGATSDASTGVTFNADTGVVSGAYAPGNTGGFVAHQLTTAEMPAHDHDIYGGYGSIPDWFGGSPADYGMLTAGNGIQYDGYLQTVGSSDFHENRPPYYALAFIMKT